ncbi:CPBP family intramembrane glutamic endopeptidase [Lentilactobacillus sp. Marseille-Q4993]|uniref:CPBP family intramembrane glutamic endopeptidase n=1 Tax=Lentilactobacillus sp. Marseille-Q4993 TaxID=3039492 RepID=UPI0024BC9DF9|nr:CPBP family intramembrane glutamic endopeptidase [Lentilactobacillus sp. Marseille-Q4993]
MILESRWTWGRQLQWGLLLTLGMLFLMFFLYDASSTTVNMVYLGVGLISFGVAVVAQGGLKVLNTKLSLTKPMLIWGVLACLAVISMMMLEGVPTNIIHVFQSKSMVLATVVAFSAAVLEESTCRGLFLSAFLNLGVYRGSKYNLTKSAVYSAILFGVLHLTNLFGGSLTAVLQQTVYAFALGVFLAALRIAANNLIWPIVLHFILDWAPMIINSSTGQSSSWLYLLAVFMPVLVLSVGYLVNADRELTKLEIVSA